jgi:hypothetical protein
MPESPALARSAARADEQCQRYPCPSCGHLVASTGPVYGMLHASGRSRTFVYLRRHKAAGQWCGQASARVLNLVRSVT